MANRDAIVALVGGAILLVATVGVFLREGVPPAPTPPTQSASATSFSWSLRGCTLASALIPVDRAAAQALVPKPFVVAAAASAPDGSAEALLMLDAYDCPNATVAGGPPHAARFAAAFLTLDAPPGNLSDPGVSSYAFGIVALSDDAALADRWRALGLTSENATITASLATPAPGVSTGSLSASSANVSFSAIGAGSSAAISNASRQRVFLVGATGGSYLDANVTLAESLLGPATFTVTNGPFAGLVANAKGAAIVGGAFTLDGAWRPFALPR